MAGKGYSVGTSTLKVVPDFTGLQTATKAAAKAMAKEISDALKTGAQNGLAPGPLQASAARTGNTVGGTLADTIRARLQAALRNLPEPTIGAATSAAEQKIRDLRENIATLSARIGVDLNSEQAAAQIATLEAELKTLSQGTTDLDIKANTERASNALALIRAEVERLKGTTTITVEANVGSFAAQVRRALERAQASLPEIEITASTTPAQRELDLLRTRIETLSGRTIGVDISAEDALADLAALETQLAALAASTTEVDVDVNAAAAAAALAAVRAEVERLRAERVVIPVEVNAGRFVAGAVAAVEAAQQALPDLSVGINSTRAQVDLAAIRADLARLNSLTIGVDISANDFYAQAQRISERARRLSAETVEVDVKADAAAVVTELGAIDRLVERLDGKTARIDIDSGSLNTFTGRLVLLGSAIVALAPAALPALGAVVVGVGAIGAAAGAVLPAVASLGLGLKGVGEALGAMSKADEDAAKNAAQAAQQRQAAAQQVLSAQRSLEGAEASLAQARASAASAATRAAAQVTQAQAAVGKAQQDAAEAAEQAQRRVADAAAALELAQADAAYSAEQSARRIAEAQRAVDEATVSASRAVEQAEQRAADARRSTADVTERAADRVASALRARENAERTLGDAQQRSIDLENALADARIGAAQDVEDMQLRLAANALRAEQNTLDLAEAQQKLAEVRADPDSSAEDIARAELAVRQQQQSIDELRVSNARLEAQYRAAAAAGVDGSAAVEAAQEAIQDNTQRIADAEQNLADQREALTDAQAQGVRDVADAQRAQAEAEAAAVQAQVEGAQRVTDAQQALADAQISAGRQAETSARQVASAQRDVADAADAVAQAQVDGAERIAQAQAQVGEAITAQAEQQRSSTASVENAVRGLEGAQAGVAAAAVAASRAGVDAVDEVAQAMDKLGPAGQRFATFLYGLRPQVEGLQNAAAGGMLPGFEEAITKLLPLMPQFETLLGTFGTAIGDLAVRAAEGLNSEPWQKFLEFLETNGAAIMETFGSILGNVLGLFPALAQSFGPIGQVVGDVLVNMGTSFNSFIAGLAGSSAFEDFLTFVTDNAPLFTEFLGAMLDALVTIVRSMAPFAPVILGVATAFANMIASLPPGVLAMIVSAVLGIVAAVNVVVPIVAALVGAFTGVAGVVSGVIAAVGGGGGLMAVLAALIPGIGPIIAIVFALGAALVAAWVHSETFRDVVKGAFSAIADAGVWLWENALKPAFEALAAFFTETLPDAALWLWHNAIEPTFDGIRKAVDVAISAVRTVLDGLVWFWQNVLRPAAEWLWHNVFEPVFQGISFAVEVAWNVIKLALDLLVFYWQNVLAPVAQWLWRNVFEPAFAGIGDAVRFAWENVIRPALDALVWFWQNVLTPAAVWLRDNVFGPVFSSIGTAVDTVWNNVLKPALEALSGFFTNTLGPAVTTGVEAFKAGFALMQAAAAVPINFVIREVYTNGIKKLFDKVAETVGSDARLPELAEIVVPDAAQKLATGGRVGGYSPHKRADNVPIMATAGEYMQPVDSVRYYGSGVMDALRRRAIPREAFQHLAGGGTVQGLVALGKKLQDMGLRVSENTYFGGVKAKHSAGGWHYKLGGAGAIDVNLGFGNPRGEKEALDKATQVARAAGFRSIWQAAGHYDHSHYDLADPSASMGSGGGGSWLGNAASKVVDGVAALGGNAAEVLGDLWNGASDVLSPFTGYLDKLKDGVGDSPFGQLAGGAARKVFDSVVQWVRDKVGGILGGSGDTGTPVQYSGGGVERWRATALKALEMTGFPASMVGSLLRRMNQESSGNPNAENGWDSNAAKGKDWRSKGLMQVIGPTFRKWALPGYSSNIFDPLSNILASIRYAASFPGGPTARWDRKGGYALGGPITDGSLSAFAALLGNAPGQLGRPLLFDEGGRLPVGLSVVANRTGTPEAVFNGRDERALSTALLERGTGPGTVVEQVFGDVYPREQVDVDLMFRRAEFALRGGGLGG